MTKLRDAISSGIARTVFLEIRKGPKKSNTDFKRKIRRPLQLRRDIMKTLGKGKDEIKR